MKISEIQAIPKEQLNAKITALISEDAKDSLDLVADRKGKTISELIREIVNDFLANNSDEIKKLVG